LSDRIEEIDALIEELELSDKLDGFDDLIIEKITLQKIKREISFVLGRIIEN
jgi:uncharacterized protein YeeX (DUF496 family)